jgi:hypothetical protein
MISAVTSAAHNQATASASLAQPAAKPAAPSQNSVPAQTRSTASPVNDTVQISTAAQAALKEALENPAQTTKEALGGDRQAQRLLAREEAAAKS